MKTLTFKTNINCSGCVARVTPLLNKEEKIQHWEVDINNPDKILTIQTEELKAEDIIQTVKRSGFTIESV